MEMRHGSFSLFLLIAALTPLRAGAQTAFKDLDVDTATDFATSVSAFDLDGDGDLDLLSTAFIDDRIAWYENDGNNPPTFTTHVLSTTADGAFHVTAADVDGDLDVDLVSAHSNQDRVSWWESDGGTPPSFVEHVVASNVNGSYSVVVADLDGDLDLDIAQSSINDDTVSWYENDGAQPPAFVEHVIATDVDFAASVHADDVDGDGDLDLLSASFVDNTVAWYENDGAADPAFVKHPIASMSGWGARAVYSADLDGDLDTDVIAALFSAGEVIWMENDGAQPPSWTVHVIVTDSLAARSVFAADVDGDDDVDVLSASGTDAKVAWHENDGGSPPSFTEHVISTNSPNSYFVFAADVNGDDRIDVLNASGNGDKITYFQQIEDPVVYCTAKVNSCGSSPAIGSVGVPSATAGSGFAVRATNTRAREPGLLLYTPSGRASLPFHGGLLCLNTAPLRRSIPVVDTTGTPGLCDGLLSIDMNAFAVGALGGTPLDELTSPGTVVNAQFWGRDTMANGSLLSDALEYLVCY